MADEHTEHSAVAEWDAALRSVHRAFWLKTTRGRERIFLRKIQPL